MASLERFLQGIRDIRAAQPTYRLGGCGADGTCDCIGLIIGAVRRAGGKWTGTHGSNYAARSEMAGGLRRITSAADLEVGEAIYKGRLPGDKDYALPSKYQTSGDLVDYYHVGVVMSVSPLEIWHCTNGGVKVDTKLGAWAWAGPLKKLNYEEGLGMQEAVIQQAVVQTPDQNPVKLRATPDTTQAYLAKILHGDKVDVLEIGSEWCTVIADGKRGYMMREFLELEGVQEGLVTGDGGQALEAWMAVMEARIEALEAALGL